MMFLHDKKHSSLFLSDKKYFSLRHLGSRAYRFEFFVSYHIFRRLEIRNMHCILNHLGIEKNLVFQFCSWQIYTYRFKISYLTSAFLDLKKFEICWMAASWSVLLQVININVITSFVISRFCGTSMAFLWHVFENKYKFIQTSVPFYLLVLKQLKENKY